MLKGIDDDGSDDIDIDMDVTEDGEDIDPNEVILLSSHNAIIIILSFFSSVLWDITGWKTVVKNF